MDEQNNNDQDNAYTDPVTGKFKPGNPGRPAGTRNKATAKLANVTEETFDELFRDAVEYIMTYGRAADRLNLIKFCASYFAGLPQQGVSIHVEGEQGIPDIFAELMRASEKKHED